MTRWNMLTLVGTDRPGIVAQVTRAIYRAGASLGETSMIRLGGNFTIMMMVSRDSSEAALRQSLDPVVRALDLCLHLDVVEADLHRHREPNVQVRVVGADRAGLVADVTGALADQGLNILALESDVAGTRAQPLYILSIQGECDRPIETLRRALSPLRAEGISIEITPIETLVG